MGAKDFDRKFGAGDDISDETNWSKARRPNASNAPTGENSYHAQTAGDPRRSVATSKMPDDLRGVAVEALSQPYEP